MKRNGHLAMMSTCGYYPEGICLHRCLKQILLIIQTLKMSQAIQLGLPHTIESLEVLDLSEAGEHCP